MVVGNPRANSAIGTETIGRHQRKGPQYQYYAMARAAVHILCTNTVQNSAKGNNESDAVSLVLLGLVGVVVPRDAFKRAHNPEVVGSNPTPATTPLLSRTPERMSRRGLSFFILSAERSGAGGRWFKSNPRNHLSSDAFNAIQSPSALLKFIATA